MKKIFVLIGLLMATLLTFGVPAKKGLSKTIVLSDGDTVSVTLHGDEYNHYWTTADGRVFVIGDNDVAKEISLEELQNRRDASQAKKLRRNNIRHKKLYAARTSKKASFKGAKKGLVILVNFKNLAMKTVNAQHEFEEMFNKKGYSKNGHIGSVRDYFLEQSYGDLAIDFDVVGPVTVSNDYAYYGANTNNGEDQHAAEMVIEACKLVDDKVDFTAYDWDQDNNVDQVFIIYAGYGEHAGASSNTIWPHEYQLSAASIDGDGSGAQTLDGVTVDTYAVSCELSGTYGTTMNGIGTACHEFSHCLGYPDFYDTSYSGGWGMQGWDVMHGGSSNGPGYNGEIPAGYTAYERWVAGWLEPVEVKAGEAYSLKSLNDNREAYIIYNDGNRNEYYLIENRKPERWFSYHEDNESDKTGLLITHVDYDQLHWYNNTPNNDAKHQRMSVVLANGKKGTYNSKNGFYYITADEYDGHLYPYNAIDSLTNNSATATTTFNPNLAGANYLPASIKNIKVNDDSSISFNCVVPYVNSNSGSNSATAGEVTFLDNSFAKVEKPVNVNTSDIVFYESFDKHKSKGGNDGKWNSIISNGVFDPDMEGWVSDAAYGANHCAKFGTTSKIGIVTSPAFTYDGEVALSFNAGAWDAIKEGTTLTLYLNDKRVAEMVMAKGAWSTFAFKTTLSGESRLKFLPSKRFFLDEVSVVKLKDVTGINQVTQPNINNKVYSVYGQYLSNDLDILPAGLYIINGKKILKK